MYSRFFGLFAFILVGYYCNRRGWLTREVNKNMGSMVMQVTIPAMLITTIGSLNITNDILVGFFLSVLTQTGAMVLFGLLMRLYAKWRKLDSRLFDMLDITTGSLNTGFLGLPIVMIFYGQSGIMYMSAGVLGLNLYLWSYGVYVLKGKQGGSFAQMQKTFLKGAINPNCIAILLGLILALTTTTAALPEAFVEFLQKLGDLSTPLSLIYIGALAGSSGICQLLREKTAFEISLVKMVGMPLLAMLFLFFAPASNLAKSVFLLVTALPAAVVVPMMVEQYGYGEKLSSDIVLLTTIFSIVEIPLIVALASVLYPVL